MPKFTFYNKLIDYISVAFNYILKFTHCCYSIKLYFYHNCNRHLFCMQLQSNFCSLIQNVNLHTNC